MQGATNTEIATDIDLLVKEATDGDANAFGILYDMYVDRVYRHVYYRIGSTEDAEDLTQQAFLKAWQAIGRYKKTASPFIAWLISISHNLVIDFYRSKKDSVYLDSEVMAGDSTLSPDKLTEAAFDQQQLRKVIMQLPGDYQKVILMRFIEGFSYSEIAASIGKSEGAVRVTLHRALARMRKILKKAKQ
ncbi:RNA polymerase sigma factor [Chloroflexota bacterium]